jgi:CheY-like chemotaxis protein
VAERQLQHLTRLVDDLLDVSRIGRGKILLRRERLDLGQLVGGIVEDHRRAVDAAQLTLALDLPPEPVWVQGDPVRLAQVVANLLNNAIKFTDPGGRIEVQVAAAGDARRAGVTVRDTGIGIDPETLPHVFEMFSQADRSLHRSPGGLGLGLALVKGLIELHGGELRAASGGPGTGAEFQFELPQAPAADGPRDAVADDPPVAPPLRILIVEDNRDAAETLRVLLELSRHQVVVAYAGAAALEAARLFRPEVVLCDLGLPGMDGLAVARALHQDPAGAMARLIAMTGYGSEADQARSREAGFEQHLTKPVNPEELQRILAAGAGGDGPP